MKKRFLFAMCAVLVTGLMVLPASADVGPKSSVSVTVSGLDGRPCYGTLLSTERSNGPLKAARPGEELDFEDHRVTGRLLQAGEAFRAYAEGTEGWYFLPTVWEVADTFAWTYRPPEGVFRIALYFPEENALVVSEDCRSYAFHSYFAVDLSGVELIPDGTVTGLKASVNYDFGGELQGLAVRTLLTVAIEAALAWFAFKFRAKNQMACILAVNILTQAALNIALNWCAFHFGDYAYLYYFLPLEIAVIFVEMFLYLLFLPGMKGDGDRGERVITYAFAANGLSMVAGWLLGYLIPFVF